MTRRFDVILCNLGPRTSLVIFLVLVGMFGRGLGGLMSVSDESQIILRFVDSSDTVSSHLRGLDRRCKTT